MIAARQASLVVFIPSFADSLQFCEKWKEEIKWIESLQPIWGNGKDSAEFFCEKRKEEIKWILSLQPISKNEKDSAEFDGGGSAQAS